MGNHETQVNLAENRVKYCDNMAAMFRGQPWVPSEEFPNDSDLMEKVRNLGFLTGSCSNQIETWLFEAKQSSTFSVQVAFLLELSEIVAARAMSLACEAEFLAVRSQMGSACGEAGACWRATRDCFWLLAQLRQVLAEMVLSEEIADKAARERNQDCYDSE